MKKGKFSTSDQQVDIGMERNEPTLLNYCTPYIKINPKYILGVKMKHLISRRKQKELWNGKKFLGQSTD